VGKRNLSDGYPRHRDKPRGRCARGDLALGLSEDLGSCDGSATASDAMCGAGEEGRWKKSCCCCCSSTRALVAKISAGRFR
jgi:hypothetical protein